MSNGSLSWPSWKYKGCRHRYYVLGGPCSWSHKVDECSKTTSPDRVRETDGCSSGQTSTQKGGHQRSIRPETTHRCDVCNTDRHFHIGLFSHKRRCNNPAKIKLKTKNKDIRMYHPWSCLTDGGLYERNIHPTHTTQGHIVIDRCCEGAQNGGHPT